MREDYDYVIVGAGSAGCVLAHRLSADPDMRVLVLEAGPPDRKLAIRIPAGFTDLFKTEYDWDYETVPQPELDGRRLYWPRGRTLGGSSAINAQMWVRGHPADYDGWAAAGNEGWAYDDVLAAFRRAERHQLPATEDRGGDGPLAISQLQQPSPFSHAFLEAARDFGLPIHDDVNVRDQEGAGMTPVTQRDGRRVSAAHAYLHPVAERPNLTVRTGALATRLLITGDQVQGVAYRHQGTERTAWTECEVLLSGGSINSPQLLLLSGVGPPDQLAEHEIGVRHELAGVGEHLQDHLSVVVIWTTSGLRTLVAASSPLELGRYLLTHGGLLSSNVGEACAFLRAMPDAPAPDLELIAAPVPYMRHGLEDPPDHGVTIGVVGLQPRSLGHIALRSADPTDQPLIDPRYCTDPEGRDLRVLTLGVKLARQLFAHRAFERWRERELWPADDARTDAELAAFVRRRAETLYHPVGTCRMGDDERAVVDAQLRVRGLQGLRVVDASIVPQIPRGHTHAPAVMIAERAAQLIAGTPHPGATERSDVAAAAG